MSEPILPEGWTVGRVILTIIVIAACIAILMVVLTVFAIPIPWWVNSIFWIVVVAVVAAFAVKLIMRLLS